MMSRKLVGFVWVLAVLIAPVGLAQSLPDDDPLQDWLARLASADPHTQRSAAYSLKTIGPDPQRSATALIEALKSANPYVRRHAAMAIGEFHVAPEAAAPALVQVLVDPDPTVREHATAALAKLGPAVFPTINKALGSDDSAPSTSKRNPAPLVGDYAAASLIEMGPEVIPLIIAGSRGGFDDSLLYVLKQQPVATTAELVKYLRSTRDDDRVQAAQTLSDLGPAGRAATPALIPLLQDTSFDVRSAATQALGSFGRSAAQPAAAAIVQNLTSNHGDLVTDSLDALRAFGPLPKEACQSIATQLHRPRPADRSKVIETLAAACRGDVNVTQALTRALRDPDASVRSAAMAALGKMGPAAAAILARHLRDADPSARAGAARGLATMGPDALPAVAALALALQDSDPGVKAAAADALSAIGPGAAAAAPGVISSLGRSDFRDPAVLVDILGHIGAARPEVVPTLVQIVLNKSDTEIAGRAAGALTRMGAAAVPALIEALNDGSCPAVKVVQAIGPAAAPSAPSLIRLLSDHDHAPCPAVLPALAAILGDAALPVLARAANDPDLGIRKEAIRAIGGLKAGFDQLGPVLLPALSDPEASVRVEAIHALARFDAARPALEKARLDPDQAVQRAAMQAMLAADEAVQRTGQPLSDWAKQLHVPDQDQRIEAAETLLDLGPLAAPAIPQLIAVLDDPNETVAALAARALLDLGQDAGELGQVQRALINDDEISSRIRASIDEIQRLNGEIKRPGRKAAPPRSEAEAESETPLPPLPSPMPGPSDWDRIDDQLLGASTATLNDIHETLRKALEDAHFPSPELFAAPGGFALITRMERIHDDGTCYADQERWSEKKIHLELSSFSLRDYLTSLFFDAPGEFRLFVFVISTTQPIPPENPSKEQDDKANLLQGLHGGRVLPSSLAGLPWQGRHGYVLLYRFERKLGEPAAEIRPETLPLRTHLEKAGMSMLVP